jgi:hypothetical protein
MCVIFNEAGGIEINFFSGRFQFTRKKGTQKIWKCLVLVMTSLRTANSKPTTSAVSGTLAKIQLILSNIFKIIFHCF